MNTVDRICELLAEKKEKFLQYEQATEELAQSDVDTAEHYITQRETLATEIDAVTEQIGWLCDGDANGALLLQAANVEGTEDELPPEYWPVRKCGEQVREVVLRIAEKEKPAIAHLKKLRDAAMEKIKGNQNLPKIKKYLTDLTEAPQGPGLRNDKV